ncbi:MAG TPA: hypothetical protein VMT89_02225 [Candidatus Acidoferrales bacterium]|nr:hypothetical protein [Candidatus Acidoferrales bacterium]
MAATVIDLCSRRASKEDPAHRFVTCEHCGERHAIVRMVNGTHHCPTAFEDTKRWFCRNRGCRAAWLGQAPAYR